MPTAAVINIGSLLTGDMRRPISRAGALFVSDGRFVDESDIPGEPDVTVDAKGLLVSPGLIDGHVHPTVGDYTPVQDSVGWIRRYLHCGVTRMVSAGELHYPGLLEHGVDASLFKAIGRINCACYEKPVASGVRVHAGTVMLAPGLSERDFDDIKSTGSTLVKFIFYPYGEVPGEDERYVRWARERGLVVKIHSGGVSRSGMSKKAGSEVVLRLRPDVVAHANGGPIPMPWGEVEEIIAGSDSAIELCYGGNFEFARRIVARLGERGELHRLVLGTDSPSGTGVVPRGMLRMIAFVSGVGGLAPELAVCAATGNVARAHGIEGGFIDVGQPADLVIMGRIDGSPNRDDLDVFACGDIPGVSVVMSGGELRVWGRSEQTPPPLQTATVQRAGAPVGQTH